MLERTAESGIFAVQGMQDEEPVAAAKNGDAEPALEVCRERFNTACAKKNPTVLVQVLLR